MVVEGFLAVTGQTMIRDYMLEHGLYQVLRGFGLVERDEHRHIAFGVRFLHDAIEQNPSFRATVEEAGGGQARAARRACVRPALCGRRSRVRLIRLQLEPDLRLRVSHAQAADGRARDTASRGADAGADLRARPGTDRRSTNGGGPAEAAAPVGPAGS